MTPNEEAVAAVLRKYQDALKASDTEAVMGLYTEDSVFMPCYSPPAVGAAAVRQAYDAVFQAISMTVEFHLAEVVEMGPGWAFARTNSMGTTTDRTTGAKSAEGNQELFIFQKSSDGDWKIARYCFAITNPPGA